MLDDSKFFFVPTYLHRLAILNVISVLFKWVLSVTWRQSQLKQFQNVFSPSGRLAARGQTSTMSVFVSFVGNFVITCQNCQKTG